MAIMIRTAIMADAAGIAELSAQLGYAANRDAIKERLTALIHHDEHCVYVAMVNDTVVGWVHGCYTLRVESDSFVEIGGLVVHEAYRNRGIGKQLVNAVIQWAETRQCRHIRVRCNVIRRESHRFYERIGFIEKKQQKIFDKLLTRIGH